MNDRVLRLVSRVFCVSIIALSPVLAACRANTANNPAQPSPAGGGTNNASSLKPSIVAPRPTTPANGALVRNLDQPVTLVVRNAVVTGGNSTTYSFEVATDSAFGAKVQTKDGVAEGGGGQTSATLTALDPNKVYYWHARAAAGGTTGAFSPISSFTIGPAIVLNPPVPASPASGAQTSPRPTLTVNNAGRSSVPPGSAIVYLFDIATNAAFSAIFISSPPIPEGPAQTSFTPGTDLSPNQVYYWRATAKDSTDGVSSPVSAVQSFSVSAGPPPGQTQQAQIAQQLYGALWPGQQPPGTNGFAVLGNGWNPHTESAYYGGTFSSPLLEELQVFDLMDRGMSPQAAIDWMHGHGYQTTADASRYPSIGVIAFVPQYMAFINGRWDLVTRVGA